MLTIPMLNTVQIFRFSSVRFDGGRENFLRERGESGDIFEGGGRGFEPRPDHHSGSLNN